MKKYNRVISVICGMALFAGISLQTNAKTTEEKISEAKQELDEQQDKLEETNKMLEQLESSKLQLEGSLAALNDKLSLLSDEMTELEEDLNKKMQEINETQKNLDTAVKVEEEQYERMKMRIKYLYELGGDGSLLQSMLEEKNFAEMLNKADYYSQITAYDRKELEEYQQTKKQIEEAKKLLENEKKSIEVLMAQKEDKQNEVQKLVNDTSTEIAKQSQNIEEVQAAALAYEKELEEKMSTVGILEAQLAYEKALKEREKNGYDNNGNYTVGEGYSSGSFNIQTSKAGYENAANSSDLDVMAAIIYCEAGGEPYEGQLAVGSVIMNRIKSSGFPDTLIGVLYQKTQFTPVMSGRFAVVLANRLATESCYQAAREVMSGVNVVPDCLFFRTVISGIEGQIIGTQIFY